MSNNSGKLSGALLLTDLNDFISLGQECVKPVKIDKTEGKKVAAIEVDAEGNYMQVNEDGSRKSLPKTKIDLNDCLACSGCITTAESVLISAQSVDEFLEKVDKLKQQQQDQTSQQQQQPQQQSPKQSVIVISISPQSRASIAAHFNISQIAAMKKLTTFFKQLGASYVFDTSWSRNFSLLESCEEFVDRYRRRSSSQQGGTTLPMLASACPGWICYAEKTHGDYILPYISTAKSPQQVLGTIVKQYFAKKISVTPDRIYHVSVMPCFDKKLEASRDDFKIEEFDTREVDCVLSSSEILNLLQARNTDFMSLPESPLESLFTGITTTATEQMLLTGVPGGAGGYLEIILRYAAKTLFGRDLPDELVFKSGRNPDFRETWLEDEKTGEKLLSFAMAYGFRNIQNLVRKIKTRKCEYHFVEIMACPSGCLNGGGQIAPKEGEKPRDLLKRITDLYHDPAEVKLISNRPWEHDAQVRQIYREWIGGGDGGGGSEDDDEAFKNAYYSENARKLLHTQYHYREKININPLAIKW